MYLFEMQYYTQWQVLGLLFLLGEGAVFRGKVRFLLKDSLHYAHGGLQGGIISVLKYSDHSTLWSHLLQTVKLYKCILTACWWKPGNINWWLTNSHNWGSSSAWVSPMDTYSVRFKFLHFFCLINCTINTSKSGMNLSFWKAHSKLIWSFAFD